MAQPISKANLSGGQLTFRVFPPSKSSIAAATVVLPLLIGPLNKTYLLLGTFSVMAFIINKMISSK